MGNNSQSLDFGIKPSDVVRHPFDVTQTAFGRNYIDFVNSYTDDSRFPDITDLPNIPSIMDINKELARRDLLEFIVQTFAPEDDELSLRDDDSKSYNWNWFHRSLCDTLNKFLEDVQNGSQPRLMITAPPRSGKSEAVSRRFPAWVLGKLPHWTMIAASYNQDLSEDMSKDVQTIMASKKYNEIFPNTRLNSTIRLPGARKATQTNKQFHVLSGSGERLGIYNAVGVGSGATGKGAHIFIIDDPIKDAQEADSVTTREGVWKWYQSVAYTRLAPKSGIIIMNTRWHEDDLSGRILKRIKEDPEFEKWELFDYKAIAEDDEEFRKKGEALHPARYPIERLLRIKQAVGSRVWASLYQQSPKNEDGGLFHRSNFLMCEPTEKPLHFVKLVRYWDRASTDPRKNKNTSDPDYTASVKIGKCHQGYYWVLDCTYDRKSPGEVDKLIKMYAMHDGRKCTVGLSEDPGQAGKHQTEFHRDLLKGYKKTIRRESGSKVLRAEMASSDVECGLFKIIRAKWNDRFFDELEFFPFGTHDDIVDCFSGAYDLLSSKGYNIKDIVGMK